MTDLTLEGYFDIQNQVQVQCQSLTQLHREEVRVRTSGKVDRATMEQLYRLCPDAEDKNYPLATFSLEASEQNLDVALECFEVSRQAMVSGLGGMLGNVLQFLLKTLQSEDDLRDIETEIDDLQQKCIKNQADIDNHVNRLRETESEVLNRSLSRQYAVTMGGPDIIRDGPSPQVTRFIEAMLPTGEIYTVLRHWSKRINSEFNYFTGHVNTFLELLDKLASVSPTERQRVIEEFNRLSTTIQEGAFAKDAHEVKEIVGHYTAAYENAGHFLTQEVFTDPGFLNAMDDSEWIQKHTTLLPERATRFRNNLMALDTYADELQGRGDTSSRRWTKLRRLVRRSMVSDQDIAETNLDEVGVNSALNAAIQEAESALRYEIEAYRSYFTSVKMTLIFYRQAARLQEQLLSARERELEAIEV